jgi:UDP-N-acetylglucosamine 2-epimerase
MRILLAFGTRPEIIKLGPVYRALRAGGAHVDAFWSGQHVDLAEGLTELFDIQVTHRCEDVVEDPSLGGKFGRIVQQTAKVLEQGHYDWVIVQGDTATAAGSAVAAFLARVPVAHVEAGLRTGTIDSPWPEEFNRRLITLASTLHFAPTEAARQNLLDEYVPDQRIHVVGNTAVDALIQVRAKIGDKYQPIDPELANLPQDKKLVLATLHRRENIGEPLDNILHALRTLGEDGNKLIVLPVHPNPGIRAQVFDVLRDARNVRLLAPLHYTDFVYLLSQAWTVVTDSGGVQEEAPTFGLQILIARESTERPEVVEAGFGTLVGSNSDVIIDGVRRLTATPAPQLLKPNNPFGRGDAACRIADCIINRVDGRGYAMQAAE